MAKLVRLLGIGPAGMAEALRLAVARQAGPPLVEYRTGDVVALAQQELPASPRRAADQAAILRELHAVQRRLEAACQVAPFLPAAPATALCAEAELPVLLEAAAPALQAALARDGATHQWTLIIRWQAEPVLAARREAIAAAVGGGGPPALAAAVGAALRAEREMREAALLAALRPVVLDLQPQPVAGDAEVSLCLLVPRGGEAVIEAALGSLPAAVTAGATADLQGPLPPVSFAAWRIAEPEQDAVRQAWGLLGLPERIDAAGLSRRWRQQAASIHPDRGGVPADGAAMAGLGSAYRLLRELTEGPQGAEVALPDVLRRAGRRLVPAGARA